MEDVVNVYRVANGLAQLWFPKIIGSVNDHYAKVARLQGELAWHKHDEQDELFLVLQGTLRLEYEGGQSVTLGPGDLHVVPRNTLHNPVSEGECYVLLFEPADTRHTGNVATDRTRSVEDQLRGPAEAGALSSPQR
jgi:mannose-6-phosphate isomerase-like protein (cupin superfamily)